jgi:hypothetical protein
MARDLQITFRNGRLMAAYFHLERRSGAVVSRSQRGPDGMFVDFTAEGVAIGIEFVAPSKVSLGGVNRVLESIGQATASTDELWPILGIQGVNNPAV